MRLADEEFGIGKKSDFIDAQKIAPFLRDGNRTAIGRGVVKGVAIPSQLHGGKSEGKVVVQSWVLPIDVGIVGEIQEQGQMPVMSTLRPDAIRSVP